ncbi:MAG: isochorismate synthase [Cellulomonadaceae bacterium]|jgi:menaquinone-specific isochorismate synthase|nr:isochorismate synthase [Cellulomonadaceae bacterium]
MLVKCVPLALPPDTALADLLPDADIVAWLHGDDGMVGWGQAFAVQLPALHQFPAAKKAWQELVAAATIIDEVGVFGSGLVGFGSFCFDPKSEAGAVLVVPRVLVGRRGSVSWLTTVDADVSAETILAAPEEPVRAPFDVVESAPEGDDWQVERTVWKAAVEEALARIAAGDAQKVVLAREITLTAPAPFSATWAVKQLAHRFADTWNYAIDSFVGATPEMLVSVRDGLVTSLVLAGTAPIPADADDEKITFLASKLLDSQGDQEKHAIAIDNVANAIAPLCHNVKVSEPEILELPNVLHLASWITGEYADPQNAITSLYLAGILHPPAAVCGTPTAAALDIIRDLELFDRGRYAGPVGWISANGDGEWGIALRGAHLVGSQARLFAGCGIAPGAQPGQELLESEAKLAPMRWALGAFGDPLDQTDDASEADEVSDAGEASEATDGSGAAGAKTPRQPALRLIKG